MSKLEDLQKAHWDAGNACRDLQCERDEKRWESVKAFERELDERLDAEYGERLRALIQAERDAEQAYLAEKEKDAAKDAPYPIGTKMVEWTEPYRSFYNEVPKKPTGRTGVIELVTRETQHPANLRYGKASVGSYVIRLLKKDGTPSLSYVELGAWRTGTWLPEGKEPKQPKVKRNRR